MSANDKLPGVPMNTIKFARLAKRAYRSKKWQVLMADDLGVTYQTINNWKQGRTPVPKYVEKYLRFKLDSGK